MEKVRERLERATAALEAAGVPYAVMGGNAVAAWVSRVDPSAVRNTADVDLLISRGDFGPARRALSEAGFDPIDEPGTTVFQDRLQEGRRDILKVFFVGEGSSDVTDLDDTAVYPPRAHRIVALPALVRMKLRSGRAKDRMHLLDLISVGLIDQTWTGRVPAELAPRLQTLLDDPNG